MIELLKSPVKVLVWSAVSLICIAIAIPLINKALTTASNRNQVSIHAHTPSDSVLHDSNRVTGKSNVRAGDRK